MRKWILIIFGLILIFVASQIFKGAWILPQVFHIGTLTIHYYGLIMASAVAAGFWLALKRVEKFSLTQGQAENILFWVAISGFVGARLYHVLSSYSYYYSHGWDVFKVYNGGLSIYGAIIGGLIAIFLLREIFNFQFLIFKTLNWLTPSIILGQIIGRFGNLFNYEAYGYPTSLPWKMFVPENFRLEQYVQYNFFHPWFLYEQLGLAVILFAIFNFEKQKIEGLFLWYLLLYNILRFGLEFLRIDSTFIHGFRQNACVSLVVLLVTAGIIIYRKNVQTS